MALRKNKRITASEVEGVPAEEEAAGAPPASPEGDDEEQWSQFREEMAQMPVPPPEGARDPSEQPAESFDDRWREAFDGLAFLGRLESDFEFAGHRFTVRTLTTAEKLEVGLIAKPFEGTLGYLKALRSAEAAAGIVLVDGSPVPVATRDASPIRQRFNWMTRTWYDPVIDAIYEQIERLEQQSLLVLDALGVFSDGEPWPAAEVGEVPGT